MVPTQPSPIDATAPGPVDPRPPSGLIDPEAARQVETQGYAVLDGRVPAEAVAELADLHRWAIDRCGQDGSGVFYPSMLLGRADVRAAIWDGVGRLTGPQVDACFAPGTYRTMGGLFVTKPASELSFRLPHQDPTAFDETAHLGLSVWIPLIDSDRTNGTLHVLPGSHRMGNHLRPRDVEAPSPALQEIALRDSVAVDLEAGQLLLLDGAVLHHSPPNASTTERVAVIAALRPADAPLHFVLSEQGDADGTAAVYEVPQEHYRSGEVVAPRFDPGALVGRRAYRQVTPADLARSLALG